MTSSAWAKCWWAAPSGKFVPLGQVAKIRRTVGSEIASENGDIARVRAGQRARNAISAAYEGVAEAHS